MLLPMLSESLPSFSTAGCVAGRPADAKAAIKTGPRWNATNALPTKLATKPRSKSWVAFLMSGEKASSPQPSMAKHSFRVSRRTWCTYVLPTRVVERKNGPAPSSHAQGMVVPDEIVPVVGHLDHEALDGQVRVKELQGAVGLRSSEDMVGKDCELCDPLGYALAIQASLFGGHAMPCSQ